VYNPTNLSLARHGLPFSTKPYQAAAGENHIAFSQQGNHAPDIFHSPLTTDYLHLLTKPLITG
jgi:hypothetical protein